MKEKRVNEFGPLPPNFDQLDFESKKVCREACYKRQLHTAFQYHVGDQQLKSGDKVKEIYKGKED